MLLLLQASLGLRKPGTVLMPSKAAGPAFTRKRFKKLIAEIEAAEEADRLAVARRKSAAIAEQVADIQRKIDARVATLLADANRPTALQLPDFPKLTHYQVASPPPFDQDEDEAIALLLLSQH